MTATKLFTQILGIKTLEVTSVEVYADRYELSVCSILAEGICPKCGKKCSKVKSYHNRHIKDLPISGKKVILDLEVRQFECDCGSYFTEQFDFVRPYKHLTIRYEAYLYYRMKGVDLTYISQKEELDWKTVKELFETYSDKEIRSCMN